MLHWLSHSCIIGQVRTICIGDFHAELQQSFTISEDEKLCRTLLSYGQHGRIFCVDIILDGKLRYIGTESKSRCVRVYSGDFWRNRTMFIFVFSGFKNEKKKISELLAEFLFIACFTQLIPSFRLEKFSQKKPPQPTWQEHDTGSLVVVDCFPSLGWTHSGWCCWRLL